MNFYSVLDDSDDEVVAPKVVAKKEKKPAAAKPAANAVPAAAPADNKSAAPVAAAVANKNNVEKPAKTAAPAPSKEKDVKKDSARKANTPNTRDDTPVVKAVGEAVEGSKVDNRGGRGRGRGDGDRRREPRTENGASAGRGGNADGAAERPQKKREFDRRSGSGRSGEQRKGGRGPRSMGNVSQEAADAEKNPDSAVPEIEPVDGAVPADAEAVPEEKPAEPEVPVVQTLSFDEYVAKRNEARANTEIFGAVSIRAVEADFSGLTTKEDDTDELFAAENKSKALKKGSQRSTAKTQVLDLGFKRPDIEVQEDDHRGAGRGDRPHRGDGRSGRGGGRSSGGRGGGDKPAARSNPSAGARININDSDSFPSL